MTDQHPPNFSAADYADTAIDFSACAFCQIVEGKSPAEIVREWERAVAFVPLMPVTKGHLLVVPRVHVSDATIRPEVTGATMEAAAELAAEAFPCNLISSAGVEATQSVMHLHIHVVPRHRGDGLRLPWA